MREMSWSLKQKTQQSNMKNGNNNLQVMQQKQKLQNLVAPELKPLEIAENHSKGTLVLSGFLDYQITKCNIKINVKSIEHLIAVTLSQWHPFFSLAWTVARALVPSQFRDIRGPETGLRALLAAQGATSKAHYSSTEAWTTWHQRNSDRHSKCVLLANTIIVWNEMPDLT